jgi:Cu/Ag efflux protein CusF
MPTHRSAFVLGLCLVVACGRTAEHTGTGSVVAVDQERAMVIIRHEAIPDLMAAMTMRFTVATPAILDGVRSGDRVRFTLRREKNDFLITSLAVTERKKDVRPPAAPAEGEGVHDHTPHHGGVVGMAGELHLEALATPEGMLRVHLTDLYRRSYPLDGVTGSVTLELPDGDRELPLTRAGEALEASGAALSVPEVNVLVALRVNGKPVEMDFVLPVTTGGHGAAGLPTRGCEPIPARRTARTPRCAFQFARAVTTLAATPDGTTALVAAVDLGLSAWQLPGGTLARALAPPPPITVPAGEGLRPHPEGANAVAVRPDGREVVVALEGRLIRYDLASGTVARELPSRSSVVRSVAWSPDGRRLLVSLFYDATAHLIEAEDGTEVRGLPVEREAAGVAFSPDGRLAAVGGELGAIAIFELAASTPPRILTGSSGAVSALAFAGTRLVSAGDDGVVRVWDPATGTLLGERRRTLSISRLAVAPGGRVVASGGLDGFVRLHDLDGEPTDEHLKWHGSQVTGLAWGGSVLVSADSGGYVAFWDLADLLGAGQASGG